MKRIIIALSILLLSNVAYADTMKASFQKSTGKLIEMQSNPTDECLINNATGMGIPENDIEIRQISDNEWKEIRESLNPKSKVQIDEEKIQKEIRSMAVDNLKKKGEI